VAPPSIANCQKLLTKGAGGWHARYPCARGPASGLQRCAPCAIRHAPRRQWAPSLIEGSEGAAIVTELAPRPEEVVVTKHTTSPFHTTDLGVYLRRLGSPRCSSPVLHHRCVEGSLRDARDQDYDVSVRGLLCRRTVQEHDTAWILSFPAWHGWPVWMRSSTPSEANLHA